MREDEIYSERRDLFKQYDTGEYSVSELCRRFGLSRTWFYKLRTRREKLGEEGLRISGRGRPGIARRLGVDIESQILEYVREHPTHGPGRIAASLNKRHLGNVHIGHTAIYGVLKKHNLNTKGKRLIWQTAVMKPQSEDSR